MRNQPVYTKKIINMISTNCLNIERLTIEVEFEDLCGIREILNNCLRLIKLNLSNLSSIDDEDEPDYDKLLEILVKFSPKTLHEFTFNNFIFTLDGLKNFFENWKGRKSLIFNIHYYTRNDFTDDYKMVIKEYLDEGVIKETKNVLY
jgi:hypothetical protein